jgi:hypothetical protein
MKAKKTTSPPEPDLKTKLLTPRPFVRTNKYLAHFRMYSIKLKRSINCEGAAAFALAIWLEVDAGVRKYSELAADNYLERSATTIVSG